MRSTLHIVLFASTVALGACGDNRAATSDAPGPGSGSGSGSGSDVALHIGGTVTGLATDGLVLTNNGGDDLTVAANATTFTFATTVDSGATYGVVVKTQPDGVSCRVASGTGVATADVTSITIACGVQLFAANQWTWLGGSKVASVATTTGVYGTQGVADAANQPGGREQPASWSDAAGNLWLFGGYGTDSVGGGGQLNDLWKYDPTANEWTWISGSAIAPASNSGQNGGQPGVYGTLGTAAAANIPGGREQLATWTDATGAVWMFGGEGNDANGITGELNDLWKFSAGQWTWMGGPSSIGGGIGFPAVSGVYGTKGVAAATNQPGGRYGAAAWSDAQGNFWLFGGSGIDSQPLQPGHLDYLNDLWKYTPGTNGTIGQWTWVAGANVVPSGSGASGVYGTLGTSATTNYPGGRDASASWVDAAGNVWIFGGIAIDSTGALGFANDLWKFEPATSKWTWVSGSKTFAADFGGLGPSGVYGTLGTAAAANAPGGRFSASSWIDASGNLWLLGGQGVDSSGGFGFLNDLWKFDVTSKQWTWMGGSQAGYQGGDYGTLGTPASTNAPGARIGSAHWLDASGKLWMFGGHGEDSMANEGSLNDLWVYKP